MDTDFRLANYFISYVAMLLFFGVGAITTLGIDWYTTLALPVWAPATALVAVIWCVLFLLTARSACLVWDCTPHSGVFRMVTALYAGNGLLVLLWNYLFFGLHTLSGALLAALAVGLSVLALVLLTWRMSRKASLLLLPYLAWMLFATYLTYSILSLNQ